MKVAYFVPDHIIPSNRFDALIQDALGIPVNYATRGRWAIMNILGALPEKGVVLIPAYLCETVLEGIVAAGFTPAFYDTDPVDMNPSMQCLEERIRTVRPVAAIVASMYGMPADLERAELICRSQQVFLIDDAAQSYGCTLNHRKIGTFGDAGFFAISTGKTLAGAMGAFWWSRLESKDCHSAKRPNCFLHRLVWKNWKENRLKAYQFSFARSTHILSKMQTLLLARDDMRHDTVCDFEKPLIAGLLEQYANGFYSYRERSWSLLFQSVPADSGWRVLDAVRGEGHKHKFVLIAPDREECRRAITLLAKHGISLIPGYSLLSNDMSILPNAMAMSGRVIELPLENNLKRMEYQANILHSILKE
jgi:hypothetical protein